MSKPKQKAAIGTKSCGIPSQRHQIQIPPATLLVEKPRRGRRPLMELPPRKAPMESPQPVAITKVTTSKTMTPSVTEWKKSQTHRIQSARCHQAKSPQGSKARSNSCGRGLEVHQKSSGKASGKQSHRKASSRFRSDCSLEMPGLRSASDRSLGC